jgi:lipid II:glycine glycyltransferase (peptidoglycan interpeptide bridge formation enzyme)
MSLHPWNTLITGLPGAHILQSWEWGQFKARYGWQPNLWVWRRTPGGETRMEAWRGGADSPQAVAGAALALTRSVSFRGLPTPLRVIYAPKGPLLDWANIPLRDQVLTDLAGLARRSGAIFIKIDPDAWIGVGAPGTQDAVENPSGAALIRALEAAGWRFSDEQIQFRNTVRVDLTPLETELLAGMKQKMRYNVRLAERKGVKVRLGGQTDLELLYRMYAETSIRDGFVIRDESYYQTAWGRFLQAGLGDVLIAEVEGEPVSALVLYRFGGTAWYFYGMSRDIHREKMPNALLQWEAMRQAKAMGCTTYDLWGAPDAFDENNPMWGVFRFKEGLGGKVYCGPGAWDLPVRPNLYRLYTGLLPRLMNVMRRRGQERTRTAIGE